MTKLQHGIAYPIKGPRLTTKKNKQGKRYQFDGSHFQLRPKKTIRVWGQDDQGVWCRVEYKYKEVPKWLRRGIRKHGKLSAKV